MLEIHFTGASELWGAVVEQAERSGASGQRRGAGTGVVAWEQELFRMLSTIGYAIEFEICTFLFLAMPRWI